MEEGGRGDGDALRGIGGPGRWEARPGRKRSSGREVLRVGAVAIEEAHVPLQVIRQVSDVDDIERATLPREQKRQPGARGKIVCRRKTTYLNGCHSRHPLHQSV